MTTLRRHTLTLTIIATCLWFASAGYAQAPGVVQAWGFNGAGQLGDGTTSNRSTPILASGLTGVTAVASGQAHSLALLSDGTVRAWGWNSSGQLGNGTTTDSHVPVAVNGLTGVVGLAAGSNHNLAILSDGSVRTWGENFQGQLGNGSNANSTTPVAPNGLGSPGPRWSLRFPPPTVVAVAGGIAHSLALLADGTVRAWGHNGWGQLGNGTTTNSNIPVTVSGLSGIVAIAAGGYHNLALRSDGTVWTWGYNGFGELGNGSNAGLSLVPMQVSGLGSVTAISAGVFHSIALLADATVRAWGHNNEGQLGNGTTVDSALPVPVSSLSGVSAVTAGGRYNLAILGDGTVRAWGANDVGLLVTGVSGSITAPAPVPNLAGVLRIAAGGANLALVNPVVSFSPPYVDFGSVNVTNGTAMRTVNISNNGPGPLTVNGFLATSGNTSDFTIVDPGLPITIQPGSSLPVNVIFDPAAAGFRSAWIMTFDTGFRSPQSILLAGTGSVSADVAVSLSALQDAVSQTITYTATVTNAGPNAASNAWVGGALTNVVSVTSSQGSCTTSATDWRCTLGTLPIGGQATVRVTTRVTAIPPVDITTTVNCGSSAVDPNLGNNSATVVTHWTGK